MEKMTLRATGLKKSYGKTAVIESLALECRRGEVIGLLGPNGAGKTTTFYMVVGLIRPDAGQVFLGEEDLTDLDLKQAFNEGAAGAVAGGAMGAVGGTAQAVHGVRQSVGEKIDEVKRDPVGAAAAVWWG